MLTLFRQVLNQKISYLRFFIYLFVAIAFILTSLFVYLTKLQYNEPLDTFYSRAPLHPKSYLFLSPKEGRYSIGDEFEINILINTAGSNVVAAAAHLSFDNTAMQALSIDTSKSVFDMQVEKEINNEQGKIKITSGKPTPGVKNNAGNVATIRFKAIEQAHSLFDNIYFDFVKGSSRYSTIIIDDNKGTNTLRVTRGAKILID